MLLKADEQVFEEHNYVDDEDREFDDFYEKRRVFGEAIKNIALVLKPENACAFLCQRLKESILKS